MTASRAFWTVHKNDIKSFESTMTKAYSKI